MTRRRRQMLVVFVMFVAVAAMARPAAAACTKSGSGGTLTVVGDTSADTVTITDSGTGLVVTGTCTGSPADVEYTTFDIRLAGGKDTVTYTLTAALTGKARSFVVQLGAGGTSAFPQTFTFDQAGFGIDGTSSISLLIVGGSGADVVTIDLDTFLNDARVNVEQLLGGGPDTSVVTVAHAGEDVVLDVDVDLGAGTNSSTLTATIVHDRATINFNLAGGTQADTANLNLTGAVATGGNLYYTARLDAGIDTFQGTLASGFDLTEGVVKIDVDGGAGNDTLRLADAGGPSRSTGLTACSTSGSTAGWERRPAAWAIR